MEKLTVNKPSTETIEVQFPFFRKTTLSLTSIKKYFAGINPTNYFEIFDSVDVINITAKPYNQVNEKLPEVYNTWEVISEEEYLKAHGEILKSLSLEPMLQEPEEEFLEGRDDLKNLF